MQTPQSDEVLHSNSTFPNIALQQSVSRNSHSKLWGATTYRQHNKTNEKIRQTCSGALLNALQKIKTKMNTKCRQKSDKN